MAKEESSLGQQLEEKLLAKKENAYDVIDEQEINNADIFCEGYKQFLDTARTEREFVQNALEAAKEKGYVLFTSGTQYKAGEKVIFNNRGKSIVFATIGKRPFNEGLKIIMAHIDSPRLDLKPCPLFEDSEMAYFKTNYYGGIKKYHWPAIPLALHGVMYKQNGSKVEIRVGEDPADPVFTVTDLLPHLDSEQKTKPMHKAIIAENLNLLIGSRPFKDEKVSNKVKLNILNLLFEKYGITEKDFTCAELEAVPCFGARDIGFDRSMIGSYGQDDRVCAYPCMMAAFNSPAPEFTTICILSDKEEVGSDGNTGMNSSYLSYYIEDLIRPFGFTLSEVLPKSLCLSADVTAAFDPAFPAVHDKPNAAFINHGVSIMKYSGSGGKYSTSDASAETMQYFRKLYDEKNVLWQIGLLGKVDAGGGGTLAQYIAKLGIDVVDIGVPVLSMHSPFEVTSKLDVYMAYRAFYEFINATV